MIKTNYRNPKTKAKSKSSKRGYVNPNGRCWSKCCATCAHCRSVNVIINDLHEISRYDATESLEDMQNRPGILYQDIERMPVCLKYVDDEMKKGLTGTVTEEYILQAEADIGYMIQVDRSMFCNDYARAGKPEYEVIEYN